MDIIIKSRKLNINSHITLEKKMELQIISRETIKPSCPTPPHLNIHTFSLFDQMTPPIYVPLVFFFSHDHGDSSRINGLDRSELLRQSLSKTLSWYYPFAGRKKDEVSIECNDEGVTFLEARLKSMTLSGILENPKSEIVELLFVDGLQWKDSKMDDHLVKIQITWFECGGLAIGLLFSHKLGDIATLVKFVQNWAVMNRDVSIGEQFIRPLFVSADLFPRGNLPVLPGFDSEEAPNCTCNRFVFEKLKIEALRNTISEKVKNPTRVEVVSALIYKTIILTLCNSNSNLQDHNALMMHALNLRPRVTPPLSENTVGNLVTIFSVAAPVAAVGEREIELHELVSGMRTELGEFCNKYAGKYRTIEWFDLMKMELNEIEELFSKIVSDQLVYRCSSWCRFPIYEVDFGWGTSAWVTMAALKIKNSVAMLDDKNGGGIEAFVTLENDQMAAFQHNEELLTFASLNPGVTSTN